MCAGQAFSLALKGIRSGEEKPVVPETNVTARVRTTGQFDCIVSFDERRGSEEVFDQMVQMQLKTALFIVKEYSTYGVEGCNALFPIWS